MCTKQDQEREQGIQLPSFLALLSSTSGRRLCPSQARQTKCDRAFMWSEREQRAECSMTWERNKHHVRKQHHSQYHAVQQQSVIHTATALYNCATAHVLRQYPSDETVFRFNPCTNLKNTYQNTFYYSFPLLSQTNLSVYLNHNLKLTVSSTLCQN